MSDFSRDISAAIDSAVEASTGSPATPDTTTSATPAGDSPTTATADTSGSEVRTALPRSTDAPTTQASDTQTTGDGQPSSKGEPPREKWETILSNARSKQEDEVLQRYGIPKGLDANTIRAHVSALVADPLGYYQQLGQALSRNGILKTEQPSASSAARVDTGNANVEPDYRAEDGTGFYSEKTLQALLERRDATLRDEISKLVNPLQEAHQATVVRQIQEESFANAKSQLDEAMTWDGFSELKDQIRDLMRNDGRVTLESAYARLHKDWRKEQDKKLQAETRQTVLAELKNKAPIANTAMPGASTPSAKSNRSPRTLDQRFDEAINREFNAAVS